MVFVALWFPAQQLTPFEEAEGGMPDLSGITFPVEQNVQPLLVDRFLVEGCD